MLRFKIGENTEKHVTNRTAISDNINNKIDLDTNIIEYFLRETKKEMSLKYSSCVLSSNFIIIVASS